MENTTKKQPQIKTNLIFWGLLSAFLLIGFSGLLILTGKEEVPTFSGERALQDVYYQTALGPRVPGSEAHESIIEWITNKSSEAGWVVDIQETTINNIQIKNVVAKKQDGAPEIIIGAHYDSRLYADKDPDPSKWIEPVPGANDGASGVAVLLELARTLPTDLDANVWLVFFDAEDNGNIPNWDWIQGSQAFVRDLRERPEAVVIIDMIGDKDLNIHFESNSDIGLSNEIWATAESLGYQSIFIPTPKYRILDDHIPFVQAGIPAVDIIDFDYAYWHTTQDTPDKVSAESLQVIGDVLTTWLLQK